MSFLESTPADLRARILEHMNAWNATCGMSFVLTNGTGDVRISRGPGGFWSYLGTDIRLIPTHRPTMNLQGFTMNTRESEYHRVVRHETGHTLGFPHEHMRRELVARIDPQRAYAFFLETQGWDRAMVDAQVLTALDDASIFGTPADQDSIMCYQLPGQITVDGQPIRGGLDINGAATSCPPPVGTHPSGGRPRDYVVRLSVWSLSPPRTSWASIELVDLVAEDVVVPGSEPKYRLEGTSTMTPPAPFSRTFEPPPGSTRKPRPS